MKATLPTLLVTTLAPSGITATAQTPEPQKRGSSTAPTIGQVRYLGMPAYRLSDGRSEAVVVPQVGRVMRYGLVGGKNLLWNSAPAKPKYGEWFNWGGDKTWPAPQSQWPLSVKYKWPPAPAWDGLPHRATVLSGGRLRMTSGIWPGIQCRSIREFGFDSKGDFLIRQTFEKVGGTPVELSLWNITQVRTPQAVFVRTNPKSAYKGNFHWIMRQNDEARATPDVQLVQPDLLRVRPNGSGYYKIGIDAPVAALVAVSDGLAFRQSAPVPPGRYPDGAEGSGFPVEIFNSEATGEQHYVEMEFLSPLRMFHPKSQWSHTVRWSLHPLASDPSSPDFAEAIESLLGDGRATE